MRFCAVGRACLGERHSRVCSAHLLRQGGRQRVARCAAQERDSVSEARKWSACPEQIPQRRGDSTSVRYSG